LEFSGKTTTTKVCLSLENFNVAQASNIPLLEENKKIVAATHELIQCKLADTLLHYIHDDDDDDD
jgi:hypothetical protein